MEGFCAGSQIPSEQEYDFFDEARSLMAALPDFEFTTDPDVILTPENRYSTFENNAFNSFDIMVRQSTPFLVNSGTAGVLITTFTILTVESLMFRFLVANAMRLGRFSNIRFETRYQAINVPQNWARQLINLSGQRNYISSLRPEDVLTDETALQASGGIDVRDARARDETHLYVDVTNIRRENDIVFINIPMLVVNEMTWNFYEQFIYIFVHQFVRSTITFTDSPTGTSQQEIPGMITRAVVLEFLQNSQRYDYANIIQRPIVGPSLQFDFLQPILHHEDAMGFMQRIGELAYRVEFTEISDEDELVNGEYRDDNYARMSMDRLDRNSLISNPSILMPWPIQDLRTSQYSFYCSLIPLMLNMKRFILILNRPRQPRYPSRQAREMQDISSDRYGGECPADSRSKFQLTCVERNSNLNIVERQFTRVINKGEFRRENYDSWREYFEDRSWGNIRDEGARMDGRTCKGFWTCENKIYGYRFDDGSFAVGITSQSMRYSDIDNWIFENGNKHKNWKDEFNGQILFDRNGRPVAIVFGMDRFFFSVLRRTWVYEFTKDDSWKWSEDEWNAPTNKLSKNEGPLVFSLKRRSMVVQSNNPWSLYDLNLVSTQRIVEMHCRNNITDLHKDWRSFYDNMHMADFQRVKHVQFKDGSYALGITNPERTKYDNVQSLITDSWTVSSEYGDKEKTDYNSGPYFGILVFDRKGRPVLTAFRENSYYISLHYYTYGDWKWIDNNNWKFVAQGKGLSKDPRAPRFNLRRCLSNL